MKKTPVKSKKVTPTSIEKIQTITSLLQTEKNQYETNDLSVYTKQIESMVTNDLYDEAMKRGLRPLADKQLTISTLIQLFKENLINRQPQQGGIDKTNIEQSKADKIRELMKVAR